jgi:hypothetical protein
MTYQEIMHTLDGAAKVLSDYSAPYNLIEATAAALVDLHNAYCSDCNLPDDYIYENDEENIRQLLPTDPLQAFYNGRMTANDYSPSDAWLYLDGYRNIISCTNGTLLENVIYLSDLAGWLDDKEAEEQQELLEPIEILVAVS